MTTTARTEQCPVCGAHATEQDRTCRYCATALKTRRCARCYEANFASSVHCAACGDELGTPPLATASGLRCPSCGQAMEAIEEPVGTLYDCPGCGGQMVAHRLFRELVEHHASLGAFEVATPPRPPSNPLAQAVRYRPCPVCAEFMHRKNFATTSGVIVDVCTRHGTFLDAGELPRILRFARDGGLARARALEAERERQQKRDDRIRAAVPVGFDRAPPLEHDRDADLLELLIDLIRRWS